jgi:multiple sugar transport system ATP-binding protein
MLENYPKACFEARIEATELLGSEIILYLQLGCKKITARLPARNTYAIGDNVKMVFDMNKMHLFDIVTGQALH